MSQCLNCGEPLTGPFCAQCGQSARTGRITFRETANQFLGSYFSVDGPLWKTTWHLIRRPEEVFNSFIEGRRQQYQKPISYFLIFTAIYLIVRELLHYDPLEGRTIEDFSGTSADGMRIHRASQFMVQHINNFLFLLTFVYAGIRKLMHYKRFNLVEYLSAGFYIAGFYIFVGTLNIVILVAMGWTQNYFNLILLTTYLIYTDIRWLGARPWYRLFIHLLAAILTLAGYVLVSFNIAYFMV